MLPHATRHGVIVRLRPRVGEHIVAGTTLAWVWRLSSGDPVPDPRGFTEVLDAGVRIGFERCTAIEQQARIIVADAEREVAQPADLNLTHAEAESVLHTIATHRPTAQPADRQTDELPAPAATA